jgi:hypothetical protein
LKLVVFAPLRFPRFTIAIRITMAAGRLDFNAHNTPSPSLLLWVVAALVVVVVVVVVVVGSL